jgi:hypothetical protein
VHGLHLGEEAGRQMPGRPGTGRVSVVGGRRRQHAVVSRFLSLVSCGSVHPVPSCRTWSHGLHAVSAKHRTVPVAAAPLRELRAFPDTVGTVLGHACAWTARR